MRVIVHTADPDPALVLLREAHPDVSFSGCNSHDGLAPAIAAEHPDVVYAMRFAGSTNYPRDPLFADNGPRWVSVGGSGIDHLGTWDTARVTVTNAAGAS